MERKDNIRECRAGEAPGAGVYVCQCCNYAIVSIKDSYMLPTCPCCEGTVFTICEQEDESHSNELIDQL